MKTLTDVTSDDVKDIARAIRESSGGSAADLVGEIAADGNYIKKSETKNVSQNLVILDAQAKANADAIELKATKSDVDELISNEESTMMLFGKVITFESDGSVTWADPV